MTGESAPVLVIGATGTVGRALVAELADAGQPPVVAVRDLVKARKLLGEASAGYRHFDISAPEIPASVFAGVKQLFLMSPMTELQVVQTQRVVSAAVAAGIEQIVRLSSRAASWDMGCRLREWHRQSDAIVAESGILWSVLRPCSFMQNLVTFSRAAIRDQGVYSVPLAPHAAIPFIDARDIARAARQCIAEPTHHHGQTYTLTGERSYSGPTVAAILSRQLGRTIRFVSSSPSQVRDSLARAGVPDWLVESGIRVFSAANRGVGVDIVPAARNLLGQPLITLERFAADHAWAWQPARPGAAFGAH